MKAIIQRVDTAAVRVNDNTIGQIGAGLLILLGIKHDDTFNQARWLADKCLNLRIFNDEKGKMNRSVQDIKGELLIISQFTLYGNAKKGRRPSFEEAAGHEVSEPIYRFFIDTLKKDSGLKIESGEFGAEMRIDSCNNGPVTIVLERDR